ncbi:MAG TPA: Uma2 family endonuclease [Pirellulaceae bacterium]|jgi:Uma2 family endonuclease
MKPIVNDFSVKLPGIGDLPPLEPGDRLTRDEFERRYEAMPNLKKAELIEGIVYMPSPVRLYRHGAPQGSMVAWLFHYQAQTPGTLAGDNTTARLDLDNEPQPDALLIIEPRSGGQTKILEDDYIEGAPELIVEVSGSTVSFDLHTKFNVYRRCGVKEYIVWRVLDRAIDWFVLAGGAYERHTTDIDGLIKSVTFPGLWLNAEAMVQLDLARVFADLQRGIASPEHAEFVKRLAANA